MANAKILKEIQTKKRKLLNNEIDYLSKGYSAIIQCKLMPRLLNLKSFNIPCTIGQLQILEALYDLGENINLMPLSMMERLVRKSRCANMKLTLTYKICLVPHGIMQDVLVKVWTFIYPVHFSNVDIEEEA